MKRAFVVLDFLLRICVFLVLAAICRVVRIFCAQRRAIIIAPPGGGNIGDEALVQVTLDKFSSMPVDVCVNHAESFQSETLQQSHVYELPRLVYGSALGILRQVLGNLCLFSGAKHFVVIGADVIDGAYNEPASFSRVWLAIFGRLIGCDTRILGFSLNASPKKSCRLSLKIAQFVGVKIFLRDPISYQRGVGVGLSKSEMCADTVFCDGRKKHFSLPASFLDNRFVIINVSGLIFRSEQSVQEMNKLVRHLIEKELRIVLLPHVSRPGADDIQVCDQLYKSVEQYHEQIFYIRELISPRQVRFLCERSKFVISGRMHLGVMALSQRKCAFIFSSQGKVEGLLKMFDLPQFEIDSSSSFGESMIPLIDSVIAEQLVVTEQTLTGVLKLAEINFEGI